MLGLVLQERLMKKRSIECVMIVMYLAWDCHCWVHQLQIRNMLCPTGKLVGVPAQNVFFFGWMVVVGPKLWTTPMS